MEQIKNTVKQGAMAELIACNWLLEQGYDVFRNITPAGWVDIIAWKKDNQPIFIDVSVCNDKHGYISDPKAGYKSRTKAYGIRFLYVYPDKSCKWRDDIFKAEKRNCVICNTEFIVKSERMNKKHCSNGCQTVGQKIGKSKNYCRNITA